MTFLEFLSNSYQESNTKLQANYEFYLHARTLATQDLISFFRQMCRYGARVELVIRFLLIKCNLCQKPKQVLAQSPEDTAA